MVDVELYQALLLWQKKESRRRSFTVKVGEVYTQYEHAAWIYDSELMAGAFIKTVQELEVVDLVAIKRESLMEEIVRLEQKKSE
jgi:hypothetical protein